MQSIMNDTQIRKSFKIGSNLKSLLCPSTFFENGTTNIGSAKKCNGTRCNLCSMILQTDIVQFENGKNYRLKSNFDCNSIFCIYAIFCPNSPYSYIGECVEIRQRFNLHISQIKN